MFNATIRTFFILTILIFTIGFISLSIYEEAKAQQKTYKVAITQIVQHPSLDKIKKGILDALGQAGYVKGKNLEIREENAQGNMAIAAQIAKSFVGSKPDVIVAISTPSAQAVLNSAKQTNSRTPIVYGAVTDPLGAKLIPSLSKPTKRITGTIDYPPVEKQIELIKKMVPTVQKIGVIYNPGEANNTFQIKAIKEAAKKAGLFVVESTAGKSADVATAAHYITKKVDVILLPNDNTVISALESIVRVAKEDKIPVFTSDPDSIERGAVAAVANDQYDVGLQTGKLVIEILKGTPPSKLLSKKITGEKVYQNKKVMKQLGLK